MKPPAQSYPLRFGYAVEFEFNGLQLSARWSPDVPSGKTAKKLLRDYRLARHRYMTDHLGPVYGNVAVLEL